MAQLKAVQRGSWTPGVTSGDWRLRNYEAPELPPLPYPVLLPYSRPELMAGRAEELTMLRRTLALPVTVVGLHAASGTGKSSLLAGGLVPTLCSGIKTGPANLQGPGVFVHPAAEIAALIFDDKTAYGRPVASSPTVQSHVQADEYDCRI